MKHAIRISVADKRGNCTEVVRTKKLTLPQKLIKLLFGDFSDVVVLAPSKSITGVEIIKKTALQEDRGGDSGK